MSHLASGNITSLEGMVKERVKVSVSDKFVELVDVRYRGREGVSGNGRVKRTRRR